MAAEPGLAITHDMAPKRQRRTLLLAGCILLATSVAVAPLVSLFLDHTSVDIEAEDGDFAPLICRIFDGVSVLDIRGRPAPIRRHYASRSDRKQRHNRRTEPGELE